MPLAAEKAPWGASMSSYLLHLTHMDVGNAEDCMEQSPPCSRDGNPWIPDQVGNETLLLYLSFFVSLRLKVNCETREAPLGDCGEGFLSPLGI